MSTTQSTMSWCGQVARAGGGSPCHRRTMGMMGGFERYAAETRHLISVQAAGSMQYIVPQRIDLAHHFGTSDETVFYFRSRTRLNSARLQISADKTILEERHYAVVRPPEMERLTLKFSDLSRLPILGDHQTARQTVQQAGRLQEQSVLIKAELKLEGGDSANENE